jgi:hypothetical protein
MKTTFRPTSELNYLNATPCPDICVGILELPAVIRCLQWVKMQPNVSVPQS